MLVTFISNLARAKGGFRGKKSALVGHLSEALAVLNAAVAYDESIEGLAV